MNILNSALGHYDRYGNIEDADVILGHSFGTSTHSESPNSAIALYILDHHSGQPIVVDQTLANAFPDSACVDYVIGGEVSNVIGTVGGSWGVLVKGNEYMEAKGFSRPLLVAHKRHVGRVAMQAAKAGMDNIIVPGDLPSMFDTESDQTFTQSELPWLVREVLGSYVLRIQGKL